MGRITLKLSMLIVSAGLSIYSCLAYSAPMSEDISICYKFNKKKLVDKSTCFIGTGYGAGGAYITIEKEKSTYNIEIENRYDKKTDSYEEGDITLNGMPVTAYYRDLFYKKIADKSLINDDSLKCFLTRNKKIDICYK